MVVLTRLAVGSRFKNEISTGINIDSSATHGDCGRSLKSVRVFSQRKWVGFYVGSCSDRPRGIIRPGGCKSQLAYRRLRIGDS